MIRWNPELARLLAEDAGEPLPGRRPEREVDAAYHFSKACVDNGCVVGRLSLDPLSGELRFVPEIAGLEALSGVWGWLPELPQEGRAMLRARLARSAPSPSGGRDGYDFDL